MKIKTSERKLFINDEEKDISTINQSELENWVENAISGTLEFELLDDSHPMNEFFKNLEKETTENSEFMNALKQFEEDKKEKDAAISAVDIDQTLDENSEIKEQKEIEAVEEDIM